MTKVERCQVHRNGQGHAPTPGAQEPTFGSGRSFSPCGLSSNISERRGEARREAKRALVEKKVGGRVSKVNMIGPKDHLTVKAIDMLRQYKVSEKEITDDTKYEDL